jgi:hypothetical protein
MEVKWKEHVDICRHNICIGWNKKRLQKALNWIDLVGYSQKLGVERMRFEAIVVFRSILSVRRVEMVERLSSEEAGHLTCTCTFYRMRMQSRGTNLPSFRIETDLD